MDYFRIKIKASKVINWDEYFNNIKTYKGWVEVTLDKGIVALFCAVYDIKDKKELREKIKEILNNYASAPLLRRLLEELSGKKGFSRLIASLLAREVARKVDKDIFDKFNEIYRKRSF